MASQLQIDIPPLECCSTSDARPSSNESETRPCNQSSSRSFSAASIASMFRSALPGRTASNRGVSFSSDGGFDSIGNRRSVDVDLDHWLTS